MNLIRAIAIAAAFEGLLVAPCHAQQAGPPGASETGHANPYRGDGAEKPEQLARPNLDRNRGLQRQLTSASRPSTTC